MRSWSEKDLQDLGKARSTPRIDIPSLSVADL